ncbi:class C sortase [Clostridiaceae bacterium OttesenSCG-928-D20]|nr:class C sortase [Clostridiaceae bacterium OttesenSCG-928-D20]
MKKTSKKILNFIAILIISAGVLATLYPVIGTYINFSRQTRVVDAYEADIKNISEVQYDEIMRSAREYNAGITYNNFSVSDKDAITDEYLKNLNFGKDYLMGYLIIPTIKVRLAIYHTVEEFALSKGIGHMPQTAFPIGGAGTHSVLTGHTGLPSSELLTNLIKLSYGDYFAVRIMNEEYWYIVDQIEVVLPDEMELLAIEDGKDYITLATCTPYGINSHRLLVRGVATDSPYVEGIKEVEVGNHSNTLIYLLIAGLIILLTVIHLVRTNMKKRRIKRNKKLAEKYFS